MRQGFKPLGLSAARRPRRGLMLSLAIFAAAAVATVFASAASAGTPQHFTFSNTSTDTITGVCSFDLTINSTFSGHGVDFFDQSGALIGENDNIVEQDTFSANGKSLTGVLFTFNLNFTVDPITGDTTQLYATGLTEKVPLPDGNFFLGAGRINFTAHGYPDFILTPDSGATRNLDEFCAALS